MRRTLEEIAEEIRDHKQAGCGFEPCETCTQLVPGEGPADARVVVVGEAPGAQEDASGRPFVGTAGKLLDKLLVEAGLARDEVFITNVVKARPPGNRDPKPLEAEHHRPWLDEQLAAIEPELVLPLGRHALKHFAPDLKISEVHGTRVEGVAGTPLVPWYHPAAARSSAMRAALHADAQALRELLASAR
ncbi:MAG TPA: uracil-DNA glycosylase [Baekduia sp.]|nr:uracil-DNA glycosylase [Baekduia sp.]